MSTTDAHGNLRDDCVSLTRGGKVVQHVRESVVSFDDVRFIVSMGKKYQSIRAGNKRAVCAWLRGTITGIEPVSDPFRFENDPTWTRVSFNPVDTDRLFHIKENGQRGADVTSAPAAVYVASSQFDNPTKCRVYIPRPN